MTALRRFDLRELPRTPWKNGGGSTREVASWPEGADLASFDWRVSVATIAQDGPFSVFPGIDRTITLLDGDGVLLRSADDSDNGGPATIEHRLDEPLAPFEFSGDAAVDCRLLGGTSTDFNVMVRRGKVRSRVELVDEARIAAPSRHGLLLCTKGAWTLSSKAGHPAVQLEAQQGVWWADWLPGLALLPTAPGSSMLVVWMDMTGLR